MGRDSRHRARLARALAPLRFIIVALNMLSLTRVSLTRSFPLRSPLFSPLKTLTLTLSLTPKPLTCPLWSSSSSSSSSSSGFCLPRGPESTTSPLSAGFCAAALSPSPPPPPMAAAGADEGLDSNPLLRDFDFPPFDVVDAKHVRPGIRELLRRLEADLLELERTVEPTWPKLVEPLERIIDRLQVVWGIVNHLKSVKDSPELRSAIEEIQARIYSLL